MLEKLREKYGEDFSWYEFTGNNLRKQIFENRLRTELTPEHSLFEKGKDLVAVAKSERNDDVLFWDGVDYYIVHLTWGKGNAHFPIYKIIHQYLFTAIHNHPHIQKADIPPMSISA